MLYKKNIHINFSCACDLNQILKENTKFLSRKILKEFYSKIINLEKFLKMYPIIKVINQIEIRKIVINSYVIIYFISKKDIYIINIYPQKSNYFNLIKV